MHVVTVEQMVAAERQAIANGVSEPALLESAGKGVAHVAWDVGLSEGSRVSVLCGVGNNAGDGFVAARYLLNQQVHVHIILTRSPEQLPSALRQHVDLLDSLGATIHRLDDRSDCIEDIQGALGDSDLIIDALLGTGAQGAPRGVIRLAVELADAAKQKVLAIDIPTGVCADTGCVHEVAVRADTTVIMSVPKLGHLLLPGSEWCGNLVTVDVGIPRSYIEKMATGEWIRAKEVAQWFPPRPVDSHKGTFGKALILAGSRRMPGAATLALQACLRSGVGLTTWAGPDCIVPTIAALTPEAILIPLRETDGVIAADAVIDVIGRVGADHAVALGPGIGTEEQAFEFTSQLLSLIGVPVVVDADALTHLARFGKWPGKARNVRILTPHPKEMARLLGTNVAEVQHDRVAAVREAAREYGAVVLLKGYPTLVASPDGRLGIVRAGNPVLSVGGTGDVLTGLVTGLLAQGCDPWRAAALGALWHGMAADRLARDGQDAGHTPMELLTQLAPTRAQIIRGPGHSNDIK